MPNKLRKTKLSDISSYGLFLNILLNLGHGDMAVSNAIGSNVFDILVCLGIPWFLETAVVDPGSYVRVRSKGKHVSKILILIRELSSSVSSGIT